MAFDAIVEDISKVPESIRGHYKLIDDGELAGKYMLDVKPVSGFCLENIVGLKTALSKERKAAEDAIKSLKEYGELSPQAAREAIKKLNEMQSWKPEDKIREQIESATRQLTEKFTKEEKELKGQLSSRDAEIEELLVTSVASQAIAKHGGNIQLLLPHIRPQVRVNRGTNGKPFAQVINADGSERISLKQGNNGGMSIEELVEVMKDSETYSPAFSGRGASGGGGANSKGGTPNRNGNGHSGDGQGMSAVQRLQAARATGNA